MSYTQESLKYRADFFKYCGLALIGTPCSILFQIILDFRYLERGFNLFTLALAILFIFPGVLSILKGIDILERYGKKDNQ